jgi:membrane-associated phospholipid phosphatase
MEREQRPWAVASGWSLPVGRFWRHLGGWPGALLRLAFVALTVLAIGQHVPAERSGLAVSLALLTVVLALTAAMPLAIYATIWATFTVLRAGVDDFSLPDRGAAIASIDRWLGNGTMPGEWLQRWLHDSALGGAFDAFAVVVHLSYFVVPHLVAVGLWWLAFSGRHRDDRHFRVYVTGLAAVMAVGMLGFALLPTSPPWLEATTTGESAGVERLAGSDAPEPASGEIYVVRDPNPVAAFPSLHQAISVIVAGALWRYDRRLGLVGVLYALAMGWALVYLGEHYLVDVLAGWALAAAVIVSLDLVLRRARLVVR